MLEHYHLAFQKGISLRGWIDIKLVRMCYSTLCYIKLYSKTISAPYPVSQMPGQMSDHDVIER